MGEVYLAEDTRINRQVALKVIRSEATPYPDTDAVKNAARLFQQEARTIAIFNHPNILPLYDFGEEDSHGTPLTYMVMPYCSEGTLTSWLQQRSTPGSLSPQDVTHLIGQAASALQHAHDHQIVHRDVKPSNFLIRSNRDQLNRPDLLLADFGIAKFLVATSNTSRTIRGTPTYMAPEQWTGAPVPASDQYALAIMAYEMLTGRPPFQGSLEQMMYQHLSVQPVAPSRLNPGLPPDVDAVFATALAKQQGDRFLSISAFGRALQQALLHASGDYGATIISRTTLPETDAIRATLAISTTEALRGARRTLTLPDGQQVTVNVPPGTFSGQMLRLEGPNIPSSTGVSAIVLTITVTNPGEPSHPANISSTAPTIMVSGASARLSDAANFTPTLAASRPGLNETSWPRQDRQGLSKVMITLLIALALLIGAGSVAFFYPLLSGKNSASLTHTGQAQGTPQTSTTATAQTNVNATVQAHATTTASASASENPYTHSGTLVLDDPLIDNGKGYNWLTGTNPKGATCEFRGGAYYSTQPAQGFFHACPERSKDFSNFAFQVRMTLISGDYAGIIFCNASENTYYLFRLGTDGSYSLLIFSQSDSEGTPLATGSTPIDLSQPHLVAAVVSGGAIKLYVDRQLIRIVNDNTYTYGRIAVFSWNASGNVAEAAFSNAKVWAL